MILNVSPSVLKKRYGGTVDLSAAFHPVHYLFGLMVCQSCYKRHVFTYIYIHKVLRLFILFLFCILDILFLTKISGMIFFIFPYFMYINFFLEIWRFGTTMMKMRMNIDLAQVSLFLTFKIMYNKCIFER